MANRTFDPAYQAVRKVLVDARETAGLTQTQVAEALGKHQSFISKIERGERSLDVVEFCRIAHVINVRPQDLVAEIEIAFGTNGR